MKCHYSVSCMLLCKEPVSRSLYSLIFIQNFEVNKISRLPLLLPPSSIIHIFIIHLFKDMHKRNTFANSSLDTESQLISLDIKVL